MNALSKCNIFNCKLITGRLNVIRLYHDVRVRFAPSPTGHLHLGGLRTALYNYLFVKKSKGTFILRIEDTDQNRIVNESANKINAMLEWMGIHVDEGPKTTGKFGPYVQSERLHLYRESAKELLANGSAYPCFCSEMRLELLRKEAAKRNETPRYDNHCRFLSQKELNVKLSKNVPSVVRLKLPNEPITFEDLVYGSITRNVALTEGDPIIMKSDGYPTYHLASVVDDHLMKISHVLRGVEWQISTSKHLILYKALGFEPPKYAHLPLIVNKDGTKLSKRQGDIHVEQFKEKGCSPEALLNFVMHVGGGCGKLEDRIYSLDDLSELFSLENVNASPARLEMERLDIMSRLHIHKLLENSNETKKMIAEVRTLVQTTFQERLGKNILQSKLLEDNNIERILRWSKNRIYTLHDLVASGLEFVWVVPDEMKSDLLKSASAKPVIIKISLLLQSVNDEEFNQDHLNPLLKRFSEVEDVKYSWLMKLLRGALSNLQTGPAVAEMMEVIGKEATLNRLRQLS